MKSQAIVTLADANYFELLLELIASIKVNEESKDISLCILDAVPLDPGLVYNLHSGANLISYPSNISMPVGDAVLTTLEASWSGANGYLDFVDVTLSDSGGNAMVVIYKLQQIACLAGIEPAIHGIKTREFCAANRWYCWVCKN